MGFNWCERNRSCQKSLKKLRKWLVIDLIFIYVYAVVSDNASAMVLMGKSVELWHVTCASHSANLLAKSLIDREFAECVNRLLKKFKRPGPEKELVKGGGKKVVLACEIRWCSHRDAFRNCLSNLPIMRELLKSQKIIVQTDISKMLSSSEFEMRLQDYVLIFDPVCEMVNKCQRSASSQMLAKSGSS